MKSIVFSLRLSLLIFVVLGVSCNNAEKYTGEWNGMQAPDGYSIEPVVDSTLISYPMFASFDNKGRLFVCESTGETFSTEDHLLKKPYHIRMLEDIDGDGKFEKSSIFADSLTYPKGAVFYQGSLYVSAAPDLLKLTDTNGDGQADKREVLLTGWVLHANAAAFGGPFIGPDGWLYLTDARRSFDITTKEGQQLKGKGARIWRCRTDGTGLEWLSGGGFDNSVEIVFMPSGETIGTMTYFTDPANGFRDALMHWVYGGVYPKPEQAIEDDHLKLTGDLMPVLDKLPRIAHSGLMRYEGTSFGEAYQGNLFSAQFNTGRIMRHIISPSGATYQTKDEAFISSSNPDIHPTDVLEDGDGSMLVVNTGGWFIAGCPLSVVAKKDIRGGIYRIRKIGAEKVQDPWGRKIDMSKMAPADIVKYVTDSRPAVRSQAIEQLIATGAAAINDIKAILLISADEEVRTAAVFMLYRINHPDALSYIREALNDKSAMVRTAAARVAGLSKDQASVPRLMEMVQSDDAAVRRQAATALGQIGNVQSINALIKASANPNDRFVEHAIIYSLITLRSPELLVQALTDSSVNMRRSALIALDQMDGSPLQKDQIVPLLNSNHEALQNTAIWVATHHPDWADVIVGFLEKSINNADKVDSRDASLRNLMIKFANSPQVQQFIAGKLNNNSLTLSKKLLLIDVMNQANIGELPDSWVKQAGVLLRSDDYEIRSAILNVIKSRRVAALNTALNQMIQDEKYSADFKLKALGARLMSDPVLTVPAFTLITHFLSAEFPSPVRQEAARLLTQSKLNDTQLAELAKTQLATADVFLLPDLISAYKGGNSEAAGMALIEALGKNTDRLENLSVADMQKLFTTYPQSVQQSALPLIKLLNEKQGARLQELEKLQAQLKRGDVANGRKIFFSNGTCMSCHAVGGEGGNFGPDLSNIGEIRSRHDILEAIMYPNASFAREHETSKLVTKNSSYTGIITEKLPDALVVATGPGSKVRVPRSEIVSVEPETVSMMPPGLLKNLSIQEISDLMAFLESLPNGLGQIKSHE